MSSHYSKGDCHDAREIDTHFRVHLRSGQSTFSVHLPQHQLLDTRRRFYFQELHVIPDFFSLEVEKWKLDADPQEEASIERDVKIRISYDDPKTYYGTHFDRGSASTFPDDLVAKINQHFEARKPDTAPFTPLFIDWIDNNMHGSMSVEKYVKELADIYYGEELDEGKHFNKLPVSVRELEGVNNYLPPIGGTMDYDEMYTERIFLRLWLAPYTKVAISNIYCFVNDLGFAAADMGVVSGRQQHIINDTDRWMIKATATEAPKPKLSKVQFKLYASVSSNPIVSRIKHISMVQRDWHNDGKLLQTLAAAFKQTSLSTNTTFSIAFNTATKTYVIQFPETDLMAVQIICDPDFAHRLGFGFTTYIVKGMTAQPQKDRHSSDDARKRAAAVVYDTGPIICQLDHLSSNTTSWTIYQTMAALYPSSSGTLSMPRAYCRCLAPLSTGSGAVPIVVNMNAGSPTYPVTFRLLRIYDNQSIKDFAWTCDAIVYGLLKGGCPRNIVL